MPLGWSIPLDKQRAKLTVFEVALFGILGGLTFAAKFVMSFLPNIEPSSLMVMLFAVVFGWKGLFPTYAYVALEILVYGISTWNIPYLYIWLLLFLAARAMGKAAHPLVWALLSGVFGLLFGLLSIPSYWAMSGFAGGIAWWISGIPYDIAHCAGNFLIALILFVPLRKLLTRLYEQKKYSK